MKTVKPVTREEVEASTMRFVNPVEKWKITKKHKQKIMERRAVILNSDMPLFNQ